MSAAFVDVDQCDDVENACSKPEAHRGREIGAVPDVDNMRDAAGNAFRDDGLDA